MNVAEEACKFANINQLTAAVYRARDEEYGNVDQAINRHPLGSVSETDLRPFLQFNVLVNINGEHKGIIGWSNPELLFFISGHNPVHLFIDATFSCVPKPFYQLLIIMIYEYNSSLYIPIFYVLMNGKTEIEYYYALQQIYNATGFGMVTASVSCDFEKALISAVSKRYEKVKIVGCLFHFKQSLRRRLVQEKIDDSDIKELMSSSGVELLTIIPVTDVVTFGIPYLKSKHVDKLNLPNYRRFWAYFEKTWLLMYDPKLWNVYDTLKDASEDDAIKIVCRTNNPLERYNKRINDIPPHPSMATFIDHIKKEAHSYLKEYEDIKKNAKTRVERTFPTLPTLPEDYVGFMAQISEPAMSLGKRKDMQCESKEVKKMKRSVD